MPMFHCEDQQIISAEINIAAVLAPGNLDMMISRVSVQELDRLSL